MKKRGVSTLAVAAGILLALAPAKARAQWTPGQPSSLVVAIGETAAAAFGDLAAEDLVKEVDVYQVAESASEGAFIALDYFTAALGDRLEAAGASTTASEWQEMARIATETLGLAYHEPREGEGGAPAEPRKAVSDDADLPDEEPDVDEAVVPRWHYSFSGQVGEPTGDDFLPGLYLVYARHVDTYTHRYVFQPFLVALPNNSYRIATEDGSYPQGTPDDWVYDVEVDLKPEQWLLCGPFRIHKELLSYNTSMDPITFAFDITIYDEKGILRSNWSTSMTFSGVGEQMIEYDDIPVSWKAVVTEEIDEGSSYRPSTNPERPAVSPADGTVTIRPYTEVTDAEGQRIEEEMAGVTVYFKNEYEPYADNQGTAVINSYEDTGSGWRFSGPAGSEGGE